MDWKTIKLNKSIELKSGENYGMGIYKDTIIIKKIIGFDENNDPIFGETIYDETT